MPTSMQHPSDEELLAWIDGELAVARRSGLESHLHECARCTARSAGLRTTLTRITAQLRTAVDPDGDTQRRRLRRALHELSDAPDVPVSVLAASAVTTPAWLHGVALVVLGLVAWILVGPPGGEGPGESHTRIAAGAAILPRPAATPGAVSTHSAADLCAGARPSRFVTDQTRRVVLASYGMSHVSADEYELDALITPELGGTTAAANLWPQRYDSPVWNARVKDDLERLLPEMVCRGEIDLANAQQAIAADWIAAYKKFFKTDAPLAAHRDTRDDDDDLVLLPASLSRSTKAFSRRTAAVSARWPAR